MTSRTETDVDFSNLVGDIYDASLDPASWPDTLTKIASFVGGQSAGVGSIDCISKAVVAHYTSGCDPHFLRLHCDTYMKLDPTSTMYFCAPGRVMTISDIMPYEDYLESRFFKEWAEPQGWVDSVNAVLEKSLTEFAIFSVYRHADCGLVDDGARQRMKLIVPHVRRAMVIGNVIEHRTGDAAAFATTLDGMNAGMFLVDEIGRIAHANASGQRMIAEGAILRSVQRTLTPADSHANRALRDVILQSSNGDAAIGVGGIVIPLTTGPGERWLAHVLPLTSGSRKLTGTKYRSVAAIFVRKGALETLSPLETLAKLYQLTPSELRVFAAVIDTDSMAAAEILGLSPATVKTHLQHLYAKTGVRRQVDLVKMLAAHAGPLQV